jgi:hypothetical protein
MPEPNRQLQRIGILKYLLATMFRALKHIMLKEESLHDNIVAAESYYLCAH